MKEKQKKFNALALVNKNNVFSPLFRMLFQGMPAPNMHLTKFVDFRKLRMEHNENLVTIPSFGYYHDYKESEKKSLIFLHHAYLLEEGKYIKRKTIFNFEKKEDKDTLLQDDKIVKKTFSDNYEENMLADIFK